MTGLTTSATPALDRAGRLARGLGIAAVLIGGLALAGAGYEALAARGDARTYPPPGQFVDVGGYRLHIQCVGTGSPTVVLDAGLGGTSLDWALVQPEIGQMTRVCAYDRAGMGWSESGRSPRTPEQNARELHTLLTNAGIDGPYVLVGHSLAGKNVRLFAALYPDQVAGMVLVDARSEYVDARTSPAEMQSFLRGMATQNSLYRAARALGLIRLFGQGLFSPPAMPAETRTAMALFGSDQQALATTSAEASERANSDAQLAAATSLGDRPLIVLASEANMTNEPNWPEAQRLLAGLSTQGRLIVPAGSGHYIQWDHPAVVIDALTEVVGRIRGE